MWEMASQGGCCALLAQPTLDSAAPDCGPAFFSPALWPPGFHPHPPFFCSLPAPVATVHLTQHTQQTLTLVCAPACTRNAVFNAPRLYFKPQESSTAPTHAPCCLPPDAPPTPPPRAAGAYAAHSAAVRGCERQRQHHNSTHQQHTRQRRPAVNPPRPPLPPTWLS